jgi:hypothetical protein
MKKLKPHRVDWAQIERFLESADRKLALAHKILAFDEEACLQQAYEAMLRASLGFMFSYGFRARSQPGHHIAIIDFVRARIHAKHAGLLTVFDRLRRRVATVNPSAEGLTVGFSRRQEPTVRKALTVATPRARGALCPVYRLLSTVHIPVRRRQDALATKGWH